MAGGRGQPPPPGENFVGKVGKSKICRKILNIGMEFDNNIVLFPFLLIFTRVFIGILAS